MAFWKLGAAVSIAILASYVLWRVLIFSDLYSGYCGGGIFFGGTRHPCPMWEYVSSHVKADLAITLFFFWWAVLLVLFVPPLIGLLIDRSMRPDAPSQET